MELVPLQVRIGLKANRQHDFPMFNELDPALRDNMDWSHFIDKFGGWHYDQISGHNEDDPLDDSPKNIWLGLLLVPSDFAQAAVARWPDRCSIKTEAEAENLYNNRCHVRDPEIKENTEIIQAIKAKRDLSIAEDQSDIDALNPDHPAAGRRRNKRKTFTGFKAVEGITIKK